MSQTKIDSVLESATNIAVGAGVALAAQLFLFPLYGIHIPLSTDLWLTLWFTIISFARSYLLRRFFNARRFWKGLT